MKSKRKKSPPPTEQMNLLPIPELAAQLGRKPKKRVPAGGDVAQWWFTRMRQAAGLD